MDDAINNTPIGGISNPKKAVYVPPPLPAPTLIVHGYTPPSRIRLMLGNMLGNMLGRLQDLVATPDSL
jgi:hypothetical protein